MLNRSTQFLLALSYLFLVTACGPRVAKVGTFEHKALKVGKVEVAVKDGALDSYQQEVYDKMSTTEAIRAETETILKQRNLFDATSDITMTILVDGFRLRHGATRAFTGFFSGSDSISAQVKWVQGESILLQKDVKASGGNGNPFAFSRNARGSGLVNGFAKVAVAPLHQEQLSEPVTVAKLPSDDSALKIVGQTAAVPAPAAEKGDKFKKEKADTCSVGQILTMKNSNLTDEQIRRACEGK